jgi:hypothetical protein
MKLSTFARSIVEEVRARAFALVADDEPLNFYPHAIALGASDRDADAIDQHLTARIMATRGAL